MSPESEDQSLHNAQRHWSFGWWSLLVFMGLGFVLEAFHAFKIGWYLNVSNETRRLMWSLAHSHGTLFSVLNLVYAMTVDRRPQAWNPRASTCLLAGSVLMPVGFLLAGVVIYGGDPGLGILLVPVGALFLITAIFLTARRV